MAEHFITDLHSHILFGIDDGADPIEESVQMLRMAEKQGVRNLFCTSHHWQSVSEDYEQNIALHKNRIAQIREDIIREVKDLVARGYKDITLQSLELVVARKGLFHDWLASKGKLGGQHKVPRLSNNRVHIEEMLAFNN